MVLVQPAPWPRCCILVYDALRLLSLPGGFEQAANSADKNSKKSTGTLDHRKLLSSRGGVEDTRLEAKAKDTKKSEAKDSFSEDRHSRGQGQECSRPRTQAQVLSKKKKTSSQKFFKRSPQKFFKRSPQKYVFQKNFQALHKILTIQKIVLSSSRGQAKF